MRINRISSSNEIFKKSKDYYENTLRASGYRATVKYTPSEQEGKNKNAIETVASFGTILIKNIDVRSNIGRNFLPLIDKNFHTDHPTK